MVEPLTLPVFILSDSTGATAERLIEAVLVQFPDVTPQLFRVTSITNRKQVAAAINSARAANGIVVFSLVKDELREYLIHQAKDLVLFDLLGPIMTKLRHRLMVTPLAQPGLLKTVLDPSVLLGQAIKFTLKHDDGLGLETLNEADILLLGISRTSKTPTSVYLACNHVLKVANWPIVVDQELPPQVKAFSRCRVGLTIDSERLVSLRNARMRGFTPYTQPSAVNHEVTFALKLMRHLANTPVVDVTDLSIEEIAGAIMKHMLR